MHASRVLRCCAIAATSVAVVATMVGCAPTDRAELASGSTSAAGSDSAGALAIVVGARSNTPPPALAGAAAQGRDSAIASQSYLAVVVADGQPFVSEQGPLLADGANPVARQQQRERNRQLVDQALGGARAKTPESDLLAALSLAARSINSRPSPHTIVVLDSGLSTTGAVDFTKPGLLDADPNELAQSLKAAHELPDLSGDDVILQGIGDVAPPQQPLDTARRTQLVAIWTAIIKEAGARDVQVEQSPLQGTPPTGLPAVSLVSLASGVSCSAGTVTLTGGDVAFQPGKAVFLDPAAAASLVKPIADQMISGGLAAQLTGTTARWGSLPEYQKPLSQQRAQAVADLLTELGVPAARMTVVGLGSDFPGYVQDDDASGALLPGPAAANRKVMIQLTGAGSVTCPQS